MEIESGLLEMPSWTTNGNKVKAFVLERLLLDKVITDSQYNTYLNEWQVIVVKRTWFKRFFESLKGGSKNGWVYQYVKFTR